MLLFYPFKKNPLKNQNGNEILAWNMNHNAHDSSCAFNILYPIFYKHFVLSEMYLILKIKRTTKL